MLYRLEQRGWIRGAWESAGRDGASAVIASRRPREKKLSPLRKEWSGAFSALRRLTKVSHA